MSEHTWLKLEFLLFRRYTMKIALTILVLFLIPSTQSLEQSQESWIEPGIGYGKIRLNEPVKELVSNIGEPPIVKRVESMPIYFWLDYSRVYVEAMGLDNSVPSSLLSASQLSPIEREYKVDGIAIYDKLARTRGNISIGSSIKDVATVFGDTSTITVSRSPLKEIKCAEAEIIKFPENTPATLRGDSYSGYALSIHYIQDGIVFYFNLDNKGDPRVFCILIWDKLECKKIL
jgi:hypothetical protein